MPAFVCIPGFSREPSCLILPGWECCRPRCHKTRRCTYHVLREVGRYVNYIPGQDLLKGLKWYLYSFPLIAGIIFIVKKQYRMLIYVFTTLSRVANLYNTIKKKYGILGTQILFQLQMGIDTGNSFHQIYSQISKCIYDNINYNTM